MYLGIKKKINEEDKKDSTLYRRIAKKVFILGAKLNNMEDTANKQDISAAISILNQAQLVLPKDSKEALRLLNIAARLAQV